MSLESPKLDQWTSGPGYDTFMGRWSVLLAQEFLKRLRLPAAQHVLDVCCGSGILSHVIASQCSPALVAAVDRAPTQVSFARTHRAHQRISYALADAMALPFPAESFGVTVCGLGLNFIPDPARALAEFRRVTRPGGTVACFVWDYSDGARFLRLFWDAALAVDPEAASFDQGRRFPICKGAGLRDAFFAAQFDNPELHALEIITRFESFDDYWEPFSTRQGSAPNYLPTRPPPIHAAIRDRLKANLPAAPDGSITLPARAWAIRARRA
jgi:SAM-dependent methyltransferase